MGRPVDPSLRWDDGGDGINSIGTPHPTIAAQCPPSPAFLDLEGRRKVQDASILPSPLAGEGGPAVSAKKWLDRMRGVFVPICGFSHKIYHQNPRVFIHSATGGSFNRNACLQG